MSESLSVVGLGKLGACIAACLASKGFPVLGFDVNPEVVERVNIGQAPVFEPDLQATIDRAAHRLRATTDPAQLIDQSNVTFLIVPTPSQADGHFSDRFLRAALVSLGRSLRTSHKPDHLFVITSTVSPGTVERSLIPLLEQTSGRQLNSGFRVCYSPEFIALGSVLRDLLNPDLLLIGESCAEAGTLLETIYQRVCDNRPVVARMSIVSAELAKLSLNAFVTMKISFANMLSNLCESVRGADIDAVTAALGADRRVSSHGLRGGASFGGPCFPRDNRALLAFADACGCDAPLPRGTDIVNQVQIERLLTHVDQALRRSDGQSVAIVGMAYKPGTNVIEESTGVKLARSLLKRTGVRIIVYDRIATDSVYQEFGDSTEYAKSLSECFTAAPVCVLTLPTEECRLIDSTYIVHRPSTVIDCWRQLSARRLGPDASYVGLGQASP